MWFKGAVIQIVLAAIQIPFFPALPSVFACGFCLGLAVASIAAGMRK